MKTKSLLPATILGAALLVVVAAIMTVTIVLNASPGPASDPGAAVPTPVADMGLAPSPDSAGLADAQPESSAQEDALEEEEELGPREAVGTAWPLKIEQATRDALVDAASKYGPSGQAPHVATGGTIYYGIVYGDTEATDVYHAIALLNDGIHHWARQGGAEWRYEGVYDARVCVPSLPARLYRAWGLVFNTVSPGAPPRTACPR
ncbi:hypothetical protein [Sphaerimonospora mesophila]|uniref:hypothetical protein n=1 Tax=Sphaerimonospora mesophila TaxID=37483 RepID=UPI0006E34CBF